MKRIIISVCLPILYACGNSTGNDNTGKQYTVEGDIITLSEESPILQNMEIQPAELHDFQSQFTTSGTVKAVPSKYAEISTPFEGRIVRSFAPLGRKVAAGSPVYEISSPSFFETGKAYYQAKQEMELAEKNLNRERDLFANNVGVKKDLEEAETDYEIKKKDYENALASMDVYQINPEETTMGRPLVVRSPIAGEIVRNNLVTGQYIKEDAEPLVIVADLNKVWVVANVKEKDIPMLHNIKDVEISLTAIPDVKIRGTVYHIGKLLDETTRSVEVIIECDNPNHTMKPFMYGMVHFFSAVTQAIVLPSTAIMQEQENDYVLVEVAKRQFVRRKVKTESVNADSTHIISGIDKGENVVIKGSIYLNM